MRGTQGDPQQKEYGIQADAYFHGGRNVQAELFLHKHGQTDERQLERRVQRKADQGKQGALVPENIGGRRARIGEQEDGGAHDADDSRRFFSEDLFQHGAPPFPF